MKGKQTNNITATLARVTETLSEHAFEILLDCESDASLTPQYECCMQSCTSKTIQAIRKAAGDDMYARCGLRLLSRYIRTKHPRSRLLAALPVVAPNEVCVSPGVVTKMVNFDNMPEPDLVGLDIWNVKDSMPRYDISILFFKYIGLVMSRVVNYIMPR